MADSQTFALVVLVAAVGGLLAVVSSRLTELIRLPLAVLVLVAASVVAGLVPGVGAPAEATVERVVSVAVVCVLFDGGMQLGWRRTRMALAPIAVVGVLGTFLTAAGGAVVLHWLFGLGWYPAVLVGTTLAPTDPTVVFSVLGRRQVGGPSGVILQGESGANDPVGIALMASLISAGGVTTAGIGHAVVDFTVQMIVGAAGGRGRRPSPGVVRPSSLAAQRRALSVAHPRVGPAALRCGHRHARVGVPGCLRGRDHPGRRAGPV